MANREPQAWLALDVPVSELAGPHAEEDKPIEKRATSVRPRKLTKMDSRASSRSVVGQRQGNFRVALARQQIGLPTSLSSACHLRERWDPQPSLVSLAADTQVTAAAPCRIFTGLPKVEGSTSPRGAQ